MSVELHECVHYTLCMHIHQTRTAATTYVAWTRVGVSAFTVLGF